MRKQEQRKVTQDIDRIRTLWGARVGSIAGERTGTEQEQNQNRNINRNINLPMRFLALGIH